jgi:site-specific recombinase XerD
MSYLEERRDLASTPPTASKRLIEDYRQYLERVRGLAAVASDFLRFLGCEDDLQRLARIQTADLESFIGEASTRVGRITMQKVIAIMRSFLRFLSASGKAPVGLDQCLESPRHHRDERLARALPWEDVLFVLRAIDQIDAERATGLCHAAADFHLWSSAQ